MTTDATTGRSRQVILSAACVLVCSLLSGVATAQEAEQADQSIPRIQCTWETLLVAWLHHESDSLDKYAGGFLYTFHNDEFQQLRNDEFSLQPRLKQAVAEMRQFGATYDPRTQYLLTVELRLGSYDFQKQGFPVEGVDLSTYYQVRAQRRNIDDIPSEFCIYLQNPQNLAFAPVKEENAREWVRSRKETDGDIDRRVKANLRFQILQNDVEGYTYSFRVRLLAGVIYDHKTNQELYRFSVPAVEKREPEPDGSPNP